MVFFKTDGTFDANNDPRKATILSLTYVALTLSIGATISSLILMDEFACISIRAARSPYVLESSKTEGDPTFFGHDWGLLRAFGLRRSTRFVISHCESCSQPGVRS